jgi:predicted amidophosphoribosyltransferase
VKYCPLCAAEYREEIGTCATCGAALVAALSSQKVRANPPRLLWSGRDLHEFDSVMDALSELHIPARPERALGGLIGAITHRASTIHVLTNDFDRALSVAEALLAARSSGSAKAPICYNCSAACSAFLAACPSCKAQLILEPIPAEDPIPGGPHSTTLKYCPTCQIQYGADFELCTVCGVALVPEELRGRPLNEKERKERLGLAWRGGDLVAFSKAIATLREHGIPHHVQATSDHLVFEIAMPRPKYIIRVFASDLSNVKELLADMQDSPFIGHEASPELSVSGNVPAIPARGPWNPAAATAEIWSGRDAALAQLLEDCFLENRIPYRRQGRAPGMLRYFVHPSDEPAAREIIREVTQATPQE